MVTFLSCRRKVTRLPGRSPVIINYFLIASWCRHMNSVFYLNRCRIMYGDARDETEVPDSLTYTELMRIDSDSENYERAARADRFLIFAECVLAGLKQWGALGFEQRDLTIDDMHTSHYLARMTHEGIDHLIEAESNVLLAPYPADVALEISLYRIAAREMKKLSEGEELMWRFLWVIGRG